MKYVFIYYIEQFCFKKITGLSSAVLNEENAACLIPATTFFCILLFTFLLWTLKSCKKRSINTAILQKLKVRQPQQLDLHTKCPVFVLTISLHCFQPSSNGIEISKYDRPFSLNYSICISNVHPGILQCMYTLRVHLQKLLFIKKQCFQSIQQL